MRETLAAYMLHMAKYPQLLKSLHEVPFFMIYCHRHNPSEFYYFQNESSDDIILCDPMCGSGTILAEAALMATLTPAAFLREKWSSVLCYCSPWNPPLNILCAGASSTFLIFPRRNGKHLNVSSFSSECLFPGVSFSWEMVLSSQLVFMIKQIAYFSRISVFWLQILIQRRRKSRPKA